MEPESDMPGMQSETWRRYVRPIIKPRRGQRDLFQIAATRTLTYDDVNIIKAVLPTGYGKTIAGLGTYLILREQGAVNRLLVLVPNDQLRHQWSESAKENAKSLGVSITKALQLDDVKAAFRYHQSGNAEIFVATYQQLIFDSRGWINDLLDFGNWMVIDDEFHHLSEEKAWGQAAGRLIGDRLCRVALMLSATPVRTDKRPTIGGGFEKDGDGWVFKPDVCVSLRDALNEEAIRRVQAHIHHYFVDVMPEGASEPTRITTEMLRTEEVADFSKYEVRRKLRYVDEYLSKMLLDAANIYQARTLRQPGQHQVLAFAMTCAHAEAVARQFDIVAGPGFADWIGVARSDVENAAILKRYQNNQLPCLVQVDKAGEGFDNPRASILVFLNLIRSGTKLTQQVGRGFRRNYAIPFKDDYCEVLASADTELAEYIQRLEIELGMKEKGEGGSEGDGDRWPLFPDLLNVDAEWEKKQLVGHENRDAELAEYLAMARAAGAPADIENDPEWLRNFARQMRGVAATKPGQIFADETAKRNHFQAEAERILKTFASKAVELHGKQNGNGFNPQLLGAVKKAVHIRWNIVKRLKHDEMMADEFKAKYYWLRDEYEKMRTLRELPEWLRL